jgi:hypothetical protein
MKPYEYLPEHYSEIKQPSYTGKGNHTVAELEDIAEQYKEYAHQRLVIEQGMEQRIHSLETQCERLMIKVEEFVALSEGSTVVLNQAVEAISILEGFVNATDNDVTGELKVLLDKTTKLLNL